MNFTYKDNPSSQYKEAVLTLQALSLREGEDTVNRAFAEVAHKARLDAFAEAYKVKLSKRNHICFHRLMGNECPGESCLSPTIIPSSDHTTEWTKNGGTSAILSQPYGLSYESLKELVEFCERYHLEATIDSGVSWHFAGRTLGILFQKSSVK